MDAEDIGQAIKARRKSLDIGQRALSEIAGVAVHTLSDIESGKGNPTVDILNRILDTLGMELVVLVPTS